MLFVPSFYVLLQRLEEYWKRRPKAEEVSKAEISKVG
ncbi:hydrophobe/amphiphile efflux-1 (HAE1) family transporter [Rhizobium sp. Pop5]|nr:hydrophobe/amphiphile efflux-1 (HAE1) family transporter [Rhizobium sp. Pop5]